MRANQTNRTTHYPDWDVKFGEITSPPDWFRYIRHLKGEEYSKAAREVVRQFEQ